MARDRRTQRGSRRKAREKALQLLFQIDATGDTVADAAASYFAQFPAGAEARAYATRLAELVAAHRDEIDALIAGAATEWPLARMSRVDRNLLRLAVAELRYVADVPPKVTINEAVEIAKAFSTPDAGGFVNAVLDRIQREHGAPAENHNSHA